jgi:hypothetical protein
MMQLKLKMILNLRFYFLRSRQFCTHEMISTILFVFVCMHELSSNFLCVVINGDLEGNIVVRNLGISWHILIS